MEILSCAPVEIRFDKANACLVEITFSRKILFHKESSLFCNFHSCMLVSLWRKEDMK